MPLFRRPDGDLVKTESPVRRMIPYLMLGRNESAVYHEERIDVSKVRPWLRAYNVAHADAPATLFHVVAYSVARGLHARPGLNRFVMGKRIYQRKGVHISFAAKKRFDDKAPLVTVKMEVGADETFPQFVQRVRERIGEGRGDKERTVDKEMKLALLLPGFLLTFVLWLLRTLDRFNLLPGALIKTDPLYTSAFLANLGSIGIDRTFHHLYEYGTASLFGVIGPQKKVPVVHEDGTVGSQEIIEMRWTFDERINDGFYCATGMRHASKLIEDPERYIGSPELANHTALMSFQDVKPERKEGSAGEVPPAT